MSVGTGSIRRAAKTAGAGETAESAAKKERKTRAMAEETAAPEQEKPGKAAASEPGKTAKKAKTPKSGREICQIGQQMPVHLL